MIGNGHLADVIQFLIIDYVAGKVLKCINLSGPCGSPGRHFLHYGLELRQVRPTDFSNDLWSPVAPPTFAAQIEFSRTSATVLATKDVTRTPAEFGQTVDNYSVLFKIDYTKGKCTDFSRRVRRTSSAFQNRNLRCTTCRGLKSSQRRCYRSGKTTDS